MRLLSLRAACLLGVGLMACALTPAESARGWIEVRSTHFRLISSLDERSSVELARRLEIFRSAALEITGLESSAPRVPTSIFVFDGRQRFDGFADDRNIQGYFIGRMRGNWATVLASGLRDVESTLFHEYTHFLIRNANGLAYPKWYDEGFAELMGAIEIEDEYLALGRPDPDRVSELRATPWIPMRRILDPHDFADWTAQKRSMFYAQAWALVHYLRYGPEGGSFDERFAGYRKALESGEDPVLAFEGALGASSRSLDRSLPPYVLLRGVPGFEIPLSRFPDGGAFEVRRLAVAEVARELGTLSLLVGRPVQAERFFLEALAARPDDARSVAGLADAYKFQGRWDESEETFRRALALDAEDALNQLDFAEYWHDLARVTDDRSEWRRLIGEARRHYVRSQRLDPDIPETYAQYGATFLLLEDDPAKAVEMLEHAHAALPSNSQIAVLLAEAYVATDGLERARALLGTVLARSHSGATTERARELLASIEAGPARP